MKALVYHGSEPWEPSQRDRLSTKDVVNSTLGIDTPAFNHLRRHPVLEAFRHAEYGELRLTLPNGQRLTFTAPHEGACADLKLRTWQALDPLLTRGQIGFAEAYVAGEWDSHDLPALFNYGLANTAKLERYFYGQAWYALWLSLKNALAGNTLRRSRSNVLKHYDLGNAFYELWLDKSMTYSGALFDGHADRSLEDAQAAKHQRILNRLALPAGAHILEVGCGWGGFAEAAARRGYHVTAITLSDAQMDYAVKRLHDQNLSHLVCSKLMDYRHVTERYDAVVSIGMFEHVGQAYWPVYFRMIKSCLNPGGKALIQSITLDDQVFERTNGKHGFIDQIIFPGGELPSKKRFCKAVEEAGLFCSEMFSFGQDYALTLRHWLQNFGAQEKKVRALGYNEAFIRQWRIYLSFCVAGFESKRTDLIQAELLRPL